MSKYKHHPAYIRL